MDPFQVTPSGYAQPYEPQYKKKREDQERAKRPSLSKRFMFWCVLLFFAGGFALTLSEVVLRIIPGQWSNTFFHMYDPVLGTWHIPSHYGDYRTQDFFTRGIEINEFGMRDVPRQIEKRPGVARIAVLGDSFTEAFHVGNTETFAQIMESKSGGKAEVLNFGVAGFGTAQELLAYQERVRQFKPDVVILAFLSANDMRNNSRALEDVYTGTYNTDRPFPRLTASNTWELVPPQPKPSANNPYILFAKRHLTTYRFLWFARNNLQARFADVLPSGSAPNTATTSVGSVNAVPDGSENVSVYLSRLFMPPKEEPFVSAWDATEWAIKKLRDEVSTDGATFVLVTLPDAVKLEPDPSAVLTKEYGAPLPSGFDIDYPEKRLRQFAQKEKITFYDLTGRFREERDRQQLSSPYFSYEHDGHWTAKGHALAGESMLAFLKDRGLIPR